MTWGVANQGWICPDAAMTSTNAAAWDSDPWSQRYSGSVNSAWRLDSGFPWWWWAGSQFRGQTNRAGSYTANSWVTRWGGWWGAFEGHQEWICIKESQIQHTSKTPVFADGVIFEACWPSENDLPAMNLQNGECAPSKYPWGMSTLTIPRHGSRPSYVTTNQSPAARLPGAINISFYDGHVAMVPLEQLWQQEWHLDWQTPAIRPGL
jgi:prepilin-type processing-associated H-X9-DG protein